MLESTAQNDVTLTEERPVVSSRQANHRNRPAPRWAPIVWTALALVLLAAGFHWACAGKAFYASHGLTRYGLFGALGALVLAWSLDLAGQFRQLKLGDAALRISLVATVAGGAFVAYHAWLAWAPTLIADGGHLLGHERLRRALPFFSTSTAYAFGLVAVVLRAEMSVAALLPTHLSTLMRRVSHGLALAVLAILLMVTVRGLAVFVIGEPLFGGWDVSTDTPVEANEDGNHQ